MSPADPAPAASSVAADAAPKPRVVLLVTLSEVGGAQNYVARLVETLVPEYDVVVAAQGQGPLADATRAAGARYVELQRMRRALSPWHDLLAFGEIVRLLRRERPLIVHANSSKAGILGRLAAYLVRVPSRIFTVNGWPFNAHSGVSARFYRLATRLVAPLTTLTICVAEKELSDGVEAHACRPSRSVVVPNAVPIPAVAGRPSNEPPIVLTVGRLKQPKDFSTLLRALAQLGRGSCRLLIAGDGPERDRLAAEADALGVGGNVEFLGERDDIPALLEACDVFALSSRSEGMPMSVLEAMAAAVPVVATAVGGVPEAVGEEAGSIVPAGDAAALATALGRLLDDPALRKRLGDAGRARVERQFSFERWRQKHLELYAAETRRGGHAAPIATGTCGFRIGGRYLTYADEGCKKAPSALTSDALSNERFNPSHDAAPRVALHALAERPTLETISDGERFAGLGETWDALVEEMPRPSPFLLHGWLREWWRFYGAGARLAVHTAWRGDRLVGALPLVIRSRFGVRTARFMGEDGSALADLLLARSEPEETARLLAERALDDDQHVADLFGIPGGSRLAAALPAGALHLIERAEAPVLDLSAGWDEVYRQKTSSKTRNLHRRRRRQLAELGELDVVVARGADELDAALDEAFKLHELRWAGRPDVSGFTTATGKLFHRAAIHALSERGAPRIVLLTLDGRGIAFHYYFALGGRMVVHRLAFDPALARYSPGLVSTLDTLESAAAEGLTAVEFLGGTERYKLELSDRLDPIYQGLGLARGPVGKAAMTTRAAALATRKRLKQVPALRSFYVERLKPVRLFLGGRGTTSR